MVFGIEELKIQHAFEWQNPFTRESGWILNRRYLKIEYPSKRENDTRNVGCGLFLLGLVWLGLELGRSLPYGIWPTMIITAGFWIASRYWFQKNHAMRDCLLIDPENQRFLFLEGDENSLELKEQKPFSEILCLSVQPRLTSVENIRIWQYRLAIVTQSRQIIPITREEQDYAHCVELGLKLGQEFGLKVNAATQPGHITEIYEPVDPESP